MKLHQFQISHQAAYLNNSSKKSLMEPTESAVAYLNMAGTSDTKIRSMDESKTKAAPFLKWAGGKRWLAPYIGPLISEHARLVEPFVGSGAVFFRTTPSAAILSDVNVDLV